MSATRRRLIVTIDGDIAARALTGVTVCLIRWQDTDPPRGPFRPTGYRGRGYELTTTPRTNLSRETRWDGWLGTTHGISRHAEGAYRVVSITEHDAPLNGEPTFAASLVKVDR